MAGEASTNIGADSDRLSSSQPAEEEVEAGLVDDDEETAAVQVVPCSAAAMASRFGCSPPRATFLDLLRFFTVTEAMAPELTEKVVPYWE